MQTGILSLTMALIGFGCAMLLEDFRQFSLAYLIIALFAATAGVFVGKHFHENGVDLLAPFLSRLHGIEKRLFRDVCR